jgi:hypothetical protein
MSPRELADALAKARAEMTSLQYDDFATKYHGKVVTWAGSVMDVSPDLLVTVRIEERGLECRCNVQFPPNARTQLAALKPKQHVQFTGTLDRYGPEFTGGFLVLNGRLQ